MGVGIESNIGAVVRVKVTGALDLSAASTLEARLRELRAAHSRIDLDLSELDFIDLTGARALAAACPGQLLSLEPARSAQAQRLFDLIDLSRLAAAA